MSALFGMRVEEIAWQIRTDLDAVVELLRGDEARGLVEQRGGGWALTASAEKQYGRALRDVARPNNVNE